MQPTSTVLLPEAYLLTAFGTGCRSQLRATQIWRTDGWIRIEDSARDVKGPRSPMLTRGNFEPGSLANRQSELTLGESGLWSTLSEDRIS
jgi:hypothetical protein